MGLINTIRHLLPRSTVWNIMFDRPFTRLVKGIAPTMDAARTDSDLVYLDLFPQTTRALDAWERQWSLPASSALTEQERRDRLEGEWRSVGGQSPHYITTTLQAHGFSVYTHEWWTIAAHGYPQPRDPRAYLRSEFNGSDPDGYLICDIIRTSRKVDEIGAGEAWAEAGEDRAVAGYYLEHQVTFVGYTASDDPDDWHTYLYIGGETFPDTVTIPTARRQEFEQLCRKLCPAQHCLVLRVQYV